MKDYESSDVEPKHKKDKWKANRTSPRINGLNKKDAPIG
jgi:hypothetical protein